MKLLVIDPEANDLDFTMRSQDAGHEVRYWTEPDCKAGEGIVPKLRTWQDAMQWADLTCVTANNVLQKELAPFVKAKFPMIGAFGDGAKLELDREFGQQVLAQYGIETIPFQVFDDYDKAIRFVESTGKAYACKAWGGESDKSLSFVSTRPDDMIFKLERWKKEKLKGPFMLQETVEGVEVGVSGWFGPGGWCSWLEEDFEEKRLMNDGLGPNCGEQGTVIRFVKKSKLFNLVLKPLTDFLQKIGYVGCINVNCQVTPDGRALPMELTCRTGWPAFSIFQALCKDDPAEWLLDLVHGKDTMNMSPEIAVGVVITHGDYPNSKLTEGDWSGYPVRGITEHNQSSMHFVDIMFGKAPVEHRRNTHTYVTSDDCILIATGTGRTVKEAQRDAYITALQVGVPGDIMYRTDVGNRLEQDLPALQLHGFVRGMQYD